MSMNGVQMTTMFLAVTITAMLVVFAVDVKQKRRQFLAKKSEEMKAAR